MRWSIGLAVLRFTHLFKLLQCYTPLIIAEAEILTVLIPVGVAKIQNCHCFFFGDFKNDVRTSPSRGRAAFGMGAYTFPFNPLTLNHIQYFHA
jgi:hypothetical protein